MDNLKIYQICHDLIDYFTTLTSKKSHLGPIFRTGVSINLLVNFYFRINYVLLKKYHTF